MSKILVEWTVQKKAATCSAMTKGRFDERPSVEIMVEGAAR